MIIRNVTLTPTRNKKTNDRTPLTDGPLEQPLELQHVCERETYHARVQRRPHGDGHERNDHNQPHCTGKGKRE